MNRRTSSRLGKADVNEGPFIDSSNIGLRPSRNKSMISNGNVSLNNDQDFHSTDLEDIYDYPVTPSRKKEKVKQKTSSDNSDEELYSGAKERKKIKNKSSETSRKWRRTTDKINCNEDEVMDNNERESKCMISVSPSGTHKNKSQAMKQVSEISHRKRIKLNTPLECQLSDVDQNEIHQANAISSPPKRSKSETEILQTPEKNSNLKGVRRTPRSAAACKISVNTENMCNGSRRSTRNSTINSYGGKYTEWCSSDDNMTKKNLKICLEKLDKTMTKRINKQSSRNVYTSESGESEVENKMNNVNENSVPMCTRLRSKSIQTPVRNIDKSTYSPTKDMCKLNINKDMGTPKSSEKQDKAQRKTQRIKSKSHCYSKYTRIESEDSSDNYEGDESDESNYDSANEHEKLKGKKNLNQRKNAATSKAHKRVLDVSMDTPKKRISRVNVGTPSLDKYRRTTNICKPSTPLQKARALLHVSVLPKSLPCREEQFNDIYSFLHARLLDGSGGCIYISGVPGTGKTATVSEVIRCLKKSMIKGELSDFDFIDINGMKLSEPRQAYVQIWKQMTGDTKSWEESHKLLQNKFNNSNSKKKMTLLLVDELDLLCTKRQDVVYNLLDWPSKANAKLVVVTIANTMDLPERILIGKVTSRLGLTRLTFPPYNFKQLEEIVVSRLKGANTFGGETIQLVARKVAAVSGDARRALDICRRAAEITEKNGRELVSMVDVKQALDEMIASPKIQAIKHCSDMEKYFLQAVCKEVQRTGVEEVVFKNVYLQMETLCSLDGLQPPNISEALEMCARLGSWRLLLCDHSRRDILQRLLLNVSTDDVFFATNEINA
ncbi:origin recognition complex subunit 1-like isoform X2 [Phymastichus coffea]|nr:origin recognition complex subunit 1-like isoform X2 [Phymastichus coffea]